MTTREFFFLLVAWGLAIYMAVLHIDSKIENRKTPCPNCECNCVQIREGTVENPGTISAEHLAVYAVGERRR